MLRHAFFSVAAITLACPLLAQDPSRAMTTDDGLDMVRVGGALLSPDGEWVFFSRSELNWDDNKRDTKYFMVSADGGDPFQFIGEDGGSGFQFSPDGAYLSFTRTVDKKSQIFLMRTAGGEAIQATKHETSVSSYRWAGDGRRIFFVADEARPDSVEKEHANGADAFFVDEGPNGQREDQWNNLWMFDIDTREEMRLTDESFLVGSFDPAPDGGRVILTARYDNLRNQQNLGEIFLLDVATKTKMRLTENRAPESAVQWAPDGVHFAYRAVSDGEWEQRENKLWVMNANTRATRMISGNFAGAIGQFRWTPDGNAILFAGRQRTNANLYRLDVARGAVTQITNVEGTLSPSSFSRDGSQMVYSFHDFDTPPDLFVSPTDGLQPTRITDANPWVATDVALGSGRVVRWQSADGREIEGLLVLPRGYREGTRLPLLLHVHGGPAGAFTNGFRSSYHVWAGLGYAQLLPNVRGSSGYGDEFLQGNYQDIGGGDYHDLMSGVDYAVREGIADPERMGIRGWSYGGILGGWTITQTDRFKAASLGAMVSDWTSEYGPGFNHDVRLWYIGGTPWDNPEAWRRMSPLTHVKNVSTPTLIMHGMNDRTDTEPQSMMFFAAIRDQGKTARYIRFPREPHGFREPRHQRTRDVEEIRWIQRYVLGEDWTPWARPAKKEKVAEDAVSAAPPGGGR